MSSIRVNQRTVGGVRTRVLSVGRRPRVVLLHGFGDSADTWRGVLADFAERGLAAMAVDQPGFGEADDLAPGPILPQLDTFLADLVCSRGGPVVLVGNSMGGTAALRAAQNPALPLAGVVSIAAPGLHDSWMLRALGTNALPVWLYSALPVPAVAVRTVASAVIPRILYARPGSACPDTVARFAGLVRDDRSTKALLAKGQVLLSELRDAYQPHEIRCPLTVVVGRKDKLVATQSGQRLHAEVPHSTLRVVDDWGHCPQLDDPAGTADLIAEFVLGTRERTLVS